ncbi:Ankyrin repeat domain-containing protein 29 [Fukomys damarensis]|uniref:Ankyrin repeat domain-containing protein 29 n=1 Tax=Fukomys damarensis TaxID=885580 RepID=A0A091D4W9_FUKDA|nr:Ankyrin repeat domain-containing protein 29 [Fukomys damarensis]
MYRILDHREEAGGTMKALWTWNASLDLVVSSEGEMPTPCAVFIHGLCAKHMCQGWKEGAHQKLLSQTVFCPLLRAVAHKPQESRRPRHQDLVLPEALPVEDIKEKPKQQARKYESDSSPVSNLTASGHLIHQRKQKETPLANAAFWAARRGNLALLKLLLNSGRVDVDCRDSHGTTLLMVASYAGHMDCVRELVLQGADINLQREVGTTALFFAAQQGHNEVVRFLFGFGASTECRTKDGGTALLAASQYGHRQVVETLLKHGANIHDQLYDGATALFLAAQGGYLDVIRLLLSSGAKVNQPRQPQSCLDKTDCFSCIPIKTSGLHSASSEFCFLCSPQCAPSSQQSDCHAGIGDGTAPLWIASQMGHSEVVRVMLLRGADRDSTRNDGTTALLKAANKGYNDVIEELLKFSPTLGLLKNGTTALHAAVLSGNIKTVALLLEAGADPALRNKANQLPAELTKNERMLRLLLSKESDGKN